MVCCLSFGCCNGYNNIRAVSDSNGFSVALFMKFSKANCEKKSVSENLLFLTESRTSPPVSVMLLCHLTRQPRLSIRCTHICIIRLKLDLEK